MMLKIETGDRFDLGTIVLTEQEIIDFAKELDPLDFHIDPKAAEKTIFRGIIASGPHLFYHIYRKEWIPRFGKSVICGLGVNLWKFVKPVRPNQKITCMLTVIGKRKDEATGGNAVLWQFEFKNEQEEMVQILQTEVVHKIP